MGWFKDMVKFENFQVKHLWERLKDDPERLLLHVSGLSFGDPATTKLWEKILGKDYEPLFNQLGGPDSGTFKAAEEAGIDTSFSRGSHKLAYMIASYYAGNYVMSQFGTGAGWGADAATPVGTPAGGAAVPAGGIEPIAASSYAPTAPSFQPSTYGGGAPVMGGGPSTGGPTGMGGYDVSGRSQISTPDPFARGAPNIGTDIPNTNPTAPSGKLGMMNTVNAANTGGATYTPADTGSGFWGNMGDKMGGAWKGAKEFSKANPEITGSVLSVVGQGLLSNSEGQRYEDMLRQRRQSHSGVEPGRNYRYMNSPGDAESSDSAGSRYGGFEYQYDPGVRRIVKVQRGAQEQRQ